MIEFKQEENWFTAPTSQAKRANTEGWKSRIDIRLETLQKAIRRRKNRDIAEFLRTGAMPSIRKQRTRWFRQAHKRAERHAKAIGARVNLTHVEKTVLFAMR